MCQGALGRQARGQEIDNIAKSADAGGVTVVPAEKQSHTTVALWAQCTQPSIIIDVTQVGEQRRFFSYS